LSELLLNFLCVIFSVDKDEVRSPKRACTERRNVLVDISFRSPVKDTIKSKSLPPLQSAFARFIFLLDSCVYLSGQQDAQTVTFNFLP
jgi:hypothetical protein